MLSERRTDQPQRWARVPAAVMGLAGVAILVLAPTGNQAGWIWPPAIFALAVWMTVQARRSLREPRPRVGILYPVFAALLFSAVGGMYETYREANDPTVGAMPGRLVDVGSYKLHINCVGTGSPTVVLEPGLGEASPTMSAWIAPALPTTTASVCTTAPDVDGASRRADHRTASRSPPTLHTLLQRAGETGPFVLAGHSAGGIYVLNFATASPTRSPAWCCSTRCLPDQYQRMLVVVDLLRGVPKSVRHHAIARPSRRRSSLSTKPYGELPEPQRDQERAFVATPRHNRSVRDEFSQIRTSLNQAAELHTLGNIPLEVLTAGQQDDDAWFSMQDDLVTLSTNSVHRMVPNASHDMVPADENTAHQSSQAILDVVSAIRTGAPITAAEA